MAVNIDPNNKLSFVGRSGSQQARARFDAMNTMKARQPVTSSVNYEETPLDQIFGANVFNRNVMRTLLPKQVYKTLLRCIDQGEALDPTIADVVANAMKDWAISRGATHFTHWFHPMTGSTAEKHDAFLAGTATEGGALIEFSGKFLIQGEPDASSFPSGGMRSTFEARGYTGWDPTSPAFLMESANGKTLCIPTVFCSFGGEALDEKTPLLRSLQALNDTGVRLANLVGGNVKRISSTVGAEQEYFLIDDAFYLARPDIIYSGRALFGARPPKGQEMEDHYWGSIKDRVLAFMMDCEAELYKLGVPVKTRHNEVAPAQFEVAPIFESANTAIDHNMLLMEVFRKIAQKHGLRCLFHEKPFSGVNGSGKHNNWSLCDDQGNNLLDPGHTPQENVQFLVMLTAVIRCMNTYGGLLRASIASAGNDLRLGANEAPPAIMSVYLGEGLTRVVDEISEGKEKSSSSPQVVQFGVATLPDIPKDNSDRNRTSPFAFTGNKFEFRAIGSSMSIFFPNTVLNTMMAESMDFMYNEIKKLIDAGSDPVKAAEKVVRNVLKENKRIIFSGDNYSSDWAEEAAKRGLPNLRNTIESLPELVKDETKALFKKYNVFTEQELVARYNVRAANFCKTINIEWQLTRNIATTIIMPACLEYQNRLATTILQTKAAIGGGNIAGQEGFLRTFVQRVNDLQYALETMDNIIAPSSGGPGGGHGEDADQVLLAKFCQEQVIPAMNEVRAAVDELELYVDDALWPLPKFRELLYLF
jgi:glutamine synthetase